MRTLLQALQTNEQAVDTSLRQTLLHAVPGSIWVEDEDDAELLATGLCWIVDTVEGNVNHIHGRSGWGVSAALVCDGVMQLCAISIPLSGDVYTAVRGQGAFVNGQALATSSKSGLQSAIVATGQATAGEGEQIYARIGQSVTAMLGAAMLVRMSVPATLELVDVAAGRLDAFWQYSSIRTGQAAGALLVAEAGGIVTDLDGKPWTLRSRNFLAAAPAVHEAALAQLARAAQDHTTKEII